MLRKEEIALIDARYFDVLRTDHISILLRSKTTGHCWRIISKESPRRHFLVEHKHHDIDPFHTQLTSKNMREALSRIKDHDTLFLEEIRQGKRSRSQLGSTYIHHDHIQIHNVRSH